MGVDLNIGKQEVHKVVRNVDKDINKFHTALSEIRGGGEVDGVTRQALKRMLLKLEHPGQEYVIDDEDIAEENRIKLGKQMVWMNEEMGKKLDNLAKGDKEINKDELKGLFGEVDTNYQSLNTYNREKAVNILRWYVSDEMLKDIENGEFAGDIVASNGISVDWRGINGLLWKAMKLFMEDYRPPSIFTNISKERGKYDAYLGEARKAVIGLVAGGKLSIEEVDSPLRERVVDDIKKLQFNKIK